jgi:hypothetical protein
VNVVSDRFFMAGLDGASMTQSWKIKPCPTKRWNPRPNTIQPLFPDAGDVAERNDGRA